jgi:RNA polymerase sigma-70 factor (ECF subfamily)
MDTRMSDASHTAEQLFRSKHGELLAALLRYAGYEHFDAVEEALQSAFQRALETWPVAGIPANPAGWLYTVARNAYLAAARRRQTEQQKLALLQHEATLGSDDTQADPTLIPVPAGDDLAVMLLLCCNPELSPKAQVCLTLKAACGLSVSEIARALAMQDEAVKKTITRAKERVAQDRAALGALQAERIAARFGPVLDTLYALFNEGYAASSGEAQLRREIAEAAIRLADVLLHTTLTPAHHRGELYALMALMLFQLARFASRSGPDGLPIRLQDQDRSAWDHELIQAGVAALAASQVAAQPTVFHLEARIAAAHALSPTFATTDWATILSLYDQLLALKDSLAVRLSRIVALRYAQGWEAARGELERLDAAGPAAMVQSFLFHAVRADLLASAGRSAEAAGAWAAAYIHAPTGADRRFVEDRLNSLT